MHSMDNPMNVNDASARPISPGQMLRAAREAKGLHLAMLSVALKVPTRQLEALENDQYDAFKGATFVRALAQSVCRHLGLDPAPVLAGLPKMASPLSMPIRSVDPVVSAGAVKWRAGSFRSKGISRRVLWLAALMLVAILALVWWPEARQEVPVPANVVQDAPPEATAPLEAASAAAEMAASAQVPVQAPVPVVSTEPVQDPAATGGSSLALRASADTWVTVRDGQGSHVFKRQIKAGESVKLDVAPPLFVYAGRADGVSLQWRGKPVDLQPYTQNNEIRLPIKP